MINFVVIFSTHYQWDYRFVNYDQILATIKIFKITANLIYLSYLGGEHVHQDAIFY